MNIVVVTEVDIPRAAERGQAETESADGQPRPTEDATAQPRRTKSIVTGTPSSSNRSRS